MIYNPAKNYHKYEGKSLKKKYTFQVILEQDEAGYFVAECPMLESLLHGQDIRRSYREHQRCNNFLS